jgi:uncharacterized phage protein (TIGR01671 family)
MREIKFRFFLEKHGLKCTVITSLEALYKENKIGQLIANDWKIIAINEYAGLIDKNKQEIYEGDVVKEEYPLKKANKEGMYVDSEEIITREGTILFNKKSMSFMIEGFEDYPVFWQDWYGPLEVIGNVYENPEYLKEKSLEGCK